VDDKLREKMEQKINEILNNTNEINEILKNMQELSSSNKSFVYGIVIGRLYNSFYYQSRRILERNPTEKEFSEFIKLLKNHEEEFLKKFNF